MNGGSAIRGWRGDDGEEPAADGVPLDLSAHQVLIDRLSAAEPAPRRWAWPAAAAIVCIAWVVAAATLAWPALPAMGSPGWPAFVMVLASVPTLIGVLWLLTQRTSRAEARRFGRSAAAMRAESEALERSIATLSAAIDTNRLKLAEQAEALAAIGQASADRLQHIGADFTAQITEANAHAASLAAATHEAQASLGVLLATLPRARAETLEAADQLDRASLAAAEHAAALDVQVAALAERGRVADEVTGGAAQRLAAHIARMEATSETAGARLEAVTDAMSTAVDGLLERTADAVDQSRQGLAAQGDAMLAMVQANQGMLDRAARESAEALATRIEVVELVIERLAQRLEVQRAAGDLLVSELERGIDRVDGRLGALHAQGVERSQLLAASISALGGSADAMTEALQTGDAMATRTIATAEALLVSLDSAAREIDETLPEALKRLDGRIAASKLVVSQAKPELLALVTAAESTHDAIEAIAQVIAGQRTILDQLSGTLLDTLTQGRSKADALGMIVDETVGRANRFADEAAPRLIEALLRVRDTAAVAADKARETLAGVIPQAAQALEGAAAEAMARATGNQVERHVAALATAADQAVAAATRAAERLDEKLHAIADNTALVETRLEHARAEREEADRESLPRRVSLLIESLNSASIDITKAFAPEVSDSAWAAYLKGDRGVFTRRAVRLLDATEARDVARLYDDDTAFREQVNRYIHDFEAMLRTILAQRDGSPLGVTLLSSDMGKLYVALAQAIERLR